MTIVETAFFHYLKNLSLQAREEHLRECLNAGGEMYFELAEYFVRTTPKEIAEAIENEQKEGK